MAPTDLYLGIWAYNRGINNSEIIQYLIFDHGHAWPGGRKPRKKADTPSKAVNATDVMWEFFEKHPKK
jgi:polyhydroxybutyrate depolymerase